MQIFAAQLVGGNFASSELGAGKVCAHAGLLESFAGKAFGIGFLDVGGGESLFGEIKLWPIQCAYVFGAPARKFGGDCGIDLGAHSGAIQRSRGNMQTRSEGGKRSYAMIGGKHKPDVSQAKLASQGGEEVGELAIERQRHGLHFSGIGANFVAKNVVGGKADYQKIGGGTAAQFFVDDELARELQLVIIGEGGSADDLIKSAQGAIFLFLRNG